MRKDIYDIRKIIGSDSDYHDQLDKICDKQTENENNFDTMINLITDLIVENDKLKDVISDTENIIENIKEFYKISDEDFTQFV